MRVRCSIWYRRSGFSNTTKIACRSVVVRSLTKRSQTAFAILALICSSVMILFWLILSERERSQTCIPDCNDSFPPSLAGHCTHLAHATPGSGLRRWGEARRTASPVRLASLRRVAQRRLRPAKGLRLRRTGRKLDQQGIWRGGGICPSETEPKTKVLSPIR